MIRSSVILYFCFASLAALASDGSELKNYIPTSQLQFIANQVSGESAKRNLDQITQYHRMRASHEFNDAATFVLRKLQASGYSNAQILSFPADGKTMFGTQKSRLAWNVEFAELWEVQQQGDDLIPINKMGDWAARPLTLAQDSDSTDVTTELVDIGAGTSADDYKNKEVRGKIVLTSSQPVAVEQLAIVERGALGVLSYTANQKTAWWQLDDSLVRWGHLGSFRDYPAFGFMISLGEARALKSRLASGERIELHAVVKAQREKADYRLVTAMLEGSDDTLKDEEIVFSCHLDHPRPGANDNASGCVAILEVARSLKRLIDDGQLPAPKRSIRFIWPCEIEGSLIFLNAKKEMAERVKHVIHMDMVGGGLQTKAVFRVSRGPYSTADISGELSDIIVDFVNENTLAFASGIDTDFPLFTPEGGREPLLAKKEWLSMGSDHDVFASGSWSIPITYLHQWPDRYIHTTKDLPDFIDPTQLKRAAFMGLVQALLLSNLDISNSAALQHTLQVAMVERGAKRMADNSALDINHKVVALQGHSQLEQQIRQSILRYIPQADLTPLEQFNAQVEQLNTIKALEITGLKVSEQVYHKNPDIKGTMHAFGYNFIDDKLGKTKAAALLLPKENSGNLKCYEALNLVNGKRNVGEIHQLLTAQFGAVSISALEEYLTALQSIHVIE